MIIRILRWAPAFMIMATSWYLSSQMRIEEMPEFWNADKLVHLVCFGGLAFWMAVGTGLGDESKRIGGLPKRLLIAAGIVSAYGILDEIHQSMVPGRSCSALDWVADSIGALAGVTIFWILIRLWNRHYSKQI